MIFFFLDQFAKLFICPNSCGRQYKYKGDLHRHWKYECGREKQFKCSECPKAFGRRSTLKTHIGIVHKIIYRWFTFIVIFSSLYFYHFLYSMSSLFSNLLECFMVYDKYNCFRWAFLFFIVGWNICIRWLNWSQILFKVFGINSSFISSYFFPLPFSIFSNTCKFIMITWIFLFLELIVELYVCPNGCGRHYKYRQGLWAHLKFECGREPQFQCGECIRAFHHKSKLKRHIANVHKKVL